MQRSSFDEFQGVSYMYIMYCDQKFSVKCQTFPLKNNYFRKKKKTKTKKLKCK